MDRSWRRCEGVPVVGSNMVDLENDLLRKRKTDPTGWQPFSVPSTCPWSWSVTSPGEPTYVRRRRRRRRPFHLVVEHRPLLVLVRVLHGDHSVGHPSAVDAVRWNIPCSPHPRNDNDKALASLASWEDI